MRNRRSWNILGLVLFMSFWSTISWAITPSWQASDTWQVKVSYPIIGKTDSWTAPITWQYRVAAVDTDSITLSISRVGGEPAAWLRVRRSDMTGIELKYTKDIRGAAREFSESFSSGTPVSSENFLAPYDLPVFPLQSEEHHEFSVVQYVAGLKSTGTITQDTASADLLPTTAASSVKGPFLKVSCARNGQELFAQYWKTGLPWPVYGENRNMRYWLVQHD